jgi:hypothetical protein
MAVFMVVTDNLVSARKVILELGSSKDAMFEKLAKYATCPESGFFN